MNEKTAHGKFRMLDADTRENTNSDLTQRDDSLQYSSGMNVI